MFNPNEHTEKNYNRRPNDKNFLFEFEDKKHIYVGKKLLSFETTDKIVEYSSNDGLNDVKHTYAHDIENIYFMLYQNIIPFEEYKKNTKTQKDEYNFLHKKDNQRKNDIIAVENEVIVD